MKSLANKIIISFTLLFSSLSLSQTIEMSNAPIADFVNWYAQLSGKGVILPAKFDDRITIYNSDIDASNLDSFFLSVMASRGYEVISGNPLIIKPNPSIDLSN
ncbi:hypothetical protein P3L44_10065 [Providencia sp. PROV175]|uniref:hypothetical protein n=1 Tax=Providencia sp. PROV175 TaxID=2949878 RepID=UPI002934853F|nr:hypothetical protein [Providencia sp. PROV175]WOB89085.1 hypothetical protein P3L44_10065 [Providencia sp. PROV175]